MRQGRLRPRHRLLRHTVEEKTGDLGSACIRRSSLRGGRRGLCEFEPCGLAGDGEGGDEPIVYSTLAACSRIRSRVLFISTTRDEIGCSAAFEPMVFTSRFSSWRRKSSFLPMGSSSVSASLNCLQWDRMRASSSAMSALSARMAASCARRPGSTLSPRSRPSHSSRR